MNQNYPLVLEGLLWRLGQQELTTGTETQAATVLEGPPWHKPSWILPLTIYGDCHRAQRPQGWIASGQTTIREGVQPHSSADNWIKALLTKALPTRTRPRFSHHQSLLSRSLHKPFGLIHQRADRTNKKHNLIAAKTKVILQKVNHDEKADNYVPDEGTR